MFSRFTSLFSLGLNIEANTPLLEIILKHKRISTTQLQLLRGGRRSCKVPWHVPRKTSNIYAQELTSDNRDFLKKVARSQYGNVFENSPLKEGPWQRNAWNIKTMRTGVLALKIGVIPQWTTKGEKFYTTLLQVLDNHVIKYTPPEKFSTSPSYKKKWAKGHGCAVVGALSCSPYQFTSNYCGLFEETGLPPKRKLTRFIVTPNAAIQPGTPLTACHFQVGAYVDVQAKTIGHGFQGVVKRWGMKGGPASHGTTKWHRRPGNIGGGRGKGKVFKGRRLPGHMGMEWSTLKGLKIWRINTKHNILYVHGQAVPGPTHCYVRVYDTVLLYRRKKMLDSPPSMPTFYKDDTTEELPEELFDDNLFQFTQPSIKYEIDTSTSKKVARKKKMSAT